MNKRSAKLILIVTQCLYAIFLFAWLFFAMISIMMFDAPGSEENKGLVALFILIWLYPAGLAAAVAASWIAYRREKLRGAILYNLIPLLWVLPIMTMLVYANTR